MSESPIPDVDGVQPTPKRVQKRSPISFALVTLVAIIGFTVSVVGITAACSRIGLWPALIVGVLFGGVAPIVLVARAASPVKKKFAPLLGHLLSIVLYGVIHAAIFLFVTDFMDRNQPDYAKAAVSVLDVVGDVPVLTGILRTKAQDARIEFGAATKAAPPTPDAGPGLVDGGPVPMTADGGPLPAVDGGPAIVPVPVVTADAISKRGKTGRVIRRGVAAVKTEAGDPALVVFSVQAGGGHKLELLSLSRQAEAGAPTAVDVADDGSVVAILGGSRLLARGPGERISEVSALRRNAMLTLDGESLQVRRLRDAVAGPKGDAVVVAELFQTLDGGVGQVRVALLHVQGTQVKKLRIAGTTLPNGDVIEDFSLRRPTLDGGLVVVQSVLQGGAGVPTDTAKPQWQVNPQAVLTAHMGNPRALVDVVRTDDAASGIAGRSAQVFFDAFVLPDGRVVVDANFVEEGAKGWLFSGSTKGFFALAPKTYPDTGPWNATSQSTPGLDVEPEGRFVFIKDGAIVTGLLDEADKANKFALKRAFTGDGTLRGAISNVHAPLLGRGGEFVLFAATVKTKEGDRSAVLLASAEDLKAGVAEVLLEEGTPLPGTAGVAKKISFNELRDLPLAR